MTAEKSSDIRERTYQFSLDLIKFIRSLQKIVFYSLIDQLLRAGTSIGANVIEAKASSSTKDFIRFYQIALKSANETQYWLSILKDSYKDSIDNEAILVLISELDEICRMLGKSLLTLKSK